LVERAIRPQGHQFAAASGAGPTDVAANVCPSTDVAARRLASVDLVATAAH
jgi:hypothetical protein